MSAAPESVVALFVYGTLRPRMRLHSWVEDAVLRSEPATVHGYTLVVARHGWFPYMVDGDVNDVVVGDVLYMRADSDELRETCAMEHAAGYESRIVEVQAKSGPVSAIAFTWSYAVPGRRPVPGNDWRKEVSGVSSM